MNIASLILRTYHIYIVKSQVKTQTPPPTGRRYPLPICPARHDNLAEVDARVVVVVQAKCTVLQFVL